MEPLNSGHHWDPPAYRGTRLSSFRARQPHNGIKRLRVQVLGSSTGESGIDDGYKKASLSTHRGRSSSSIVKKYSTAITTLSSLKNLQAMGCIIIM